MPVQGRIIDTRALIRTENKDGSRQYNRYLDGKNDSDIAPEIFQILAYCHLNIG